MNNHAANLWKDYFLEHHQRIEAMVQTRRRPFSGAKKPSFRNDRRSHEPAPSSALSHSHSNSPDRTRHDLSSKEQGSSTSMKASYRSNGSKPHTSRKRSNTRLLSREPSPPTEVVPLQCGRFQYTQEEKDYFFRYVQWRYQQDPSVKKLQICEELYEKVSCFFSPPSIWT